MKIQFNQKLFEEYNLPLKQRKGNNIVSEMFNFVIVTFIDGSLGEVSIKSTVANRNSSQENCTNSLKPNSKFYILNLTYTIYNTSVLQSSLYYYCIMLYTGLYCILYNQTTQHDIDISIFPHNNDIIFYI